MIRKILPVLLALAAFLGGAAAGDMMRGKSGGAADEAADHAAAGGRDRRGRAWRGTGQF